MNQIEDIKPMVSVVMITYNHEAFIAEAIEGVLMQVADFPIEFIIADDCSPDRTNEIVQNYINKHPNGKWIKYTRHSNNKGMMPNFIWALKKAKGKYIALCEGDDYWTDPLKLQKQVDFLEKNKNFSICFHSVLELTDGVLMSDSISRNNKNELTLDDVLLKNYAHTPSLLFRNPDDFENYPDWFYESMPGDHTLQIMLLRNGEKAKYLDENMAVYRRHDGGVWSSNQGQLFKFERAITKININKYLEIKDLNLTISPFYILADYLSQNDYMKISFNKYYKLLFSQFGWKGVFSIKYFFIFHPIFVTKLRKFIR